MNHFSAKKIIISLAILAGLVLAMNFNFFWQNVKYTFTQRPNPTSTSSASKKPLTQEPNFLTIKSLSISAPIVYVGQSTGEVFQKALETGVVHYPGTALPGQFGNVYIFGHSSDYVWKKGNFKTVLALLPRIETGAEIQVTNQLGETFIYTVTESFVASAKDVHLLDQGEYKKKLLTLQTSWPIGTALKRYIVRAEMK